MFTTLASDPKLKQLIPGVTFDRSKWTQEETPIGVDTWSNAFSGLDQYGLGGFGSISPLGDPNNPSAFMARREDPNGDPMVYQTRQMMVNPDGSVSWGGDWQNAQRVPKGQFIRDGLMLAAAGAGAAGYLGNAIAGGGLGGMSGMDMAADAALGSGNNIATAGSMLGGSGMAGTGIPAFQQLPGYGNNVATLADASGASPFTGATYDPVSAYLTNGASEGSTIGNALTGAGGSAGAVGAGTTAGTLGTIGNALGSVGNLMGKKTINGFGLGDALSLGGNLLNSYLGYNAANKAADAQVNAANQANQLAKYMYDQTRQDNMPALEARNAGLTGYQNLLKNPGSVTQDPGYQFGFQQGQNAYDNSGAARGMRLSGAQAKALTRYGQDYAGTKYNEALGRYGQLAGIGQPGTNTIAGAGQNYSNQFSQNTTGAGNAAAAGYIGGANAISGGISNFLRNWQESNLLKQLGIGG